MTTTVAAHRRPVVQGSEAMTLTTTASPTTSMPSVFRATATDRPHGKTQ